MRIAMLSWESLHSIPVGGVAAHVSELAEALAESGHEVHIFTRAGENQPEYECIGNVHEHRCRYQHHDDFIDDVNSMCGAIVEQVRATEDFLGPFDIIHAHDWLAANAMIWLKQQRGRRSIITIHSTEYGRCGNTFPDGPSARIREQERAGLYWCDHAIAVSGVTQAEIADMYNVPAWKSSVIHNGVRNTRFEIAIDPVHEKSQYGIDVLDPTVLFCGRMAFQKGPDLLLEAIPSLLKYYDRAKFIFAGDGDMRPSLEQRANDMGIAHAVRFAGYRNGSELPRLYNMADVVCVPSRNEPFGIVVLEAWSAGKPVVVTQIGGPEEYVEHEVTGLKVYPNTDSVAWGLGTMFMDFDRARRMGANGRDTVQRRFTWDRVAEKTLAVYDPSYVPRMRDVTLSSQVRAAAIAEPTDQRRSNVTVHRRQREANGAASRRASPIDSPAIIAANVARSASRITDRPELNPADDLLDMLRHCGTILRKVEEILPPSPNEPPPNAAARSSDRAHGRRNGDFPRERPRSDYAPDAKTRQPVEVAQ